MSESEHQVTARPEPPTDPRFPREVHGYRALKRISAALASTLQPLQVVRIVLREVIELTAAEIAVVYLRDEAAGTLAPKLWHGRDVPPPVLDLNVSDDIAVEVAHTGVVRQKFGGADPAGTGNQPCRLVVPLVAGDDILGVIDIEVPRCAPFDLLTEELLSTLAAQAAQVFFNASLYAELDQHYREVSLLYEVQQMITSTVDYHNLLALLVESAKRMLSAGEVTIRLLRERGGIKIVTLEATTGQLMLGPRELPFEQSYIDQAVSGGDLLAIENVMQEASFPQREAAAAAGIVSILCAPMMLRQEFIGSLTVLTPMRHEFSLSERKLLLAVAGQAASAIENTRLYRQVESQNRELLRSNRLLQRTQKELLRKERLAALGEMAATVAHEIRNPLTSIRGFAQRIARKNPPLAPERMTEYTEIIIEEVDRLNRFIKDVLDFARRSKPMLARTNVNHILSDLINFMREELTGNRVMLVPSLDLDLRETVLDEALIRQMLLNLLQNARQAVGDEGVIMISTQNMGPNIRIRISDNGVGIPRSDLPRIWSPFYTTKSHGTGLGLPFAHRIVEDHQGRIALRSRVGFGTIVDILLPVFETEEDFLAAAAGAPAGDESQGGSE